MHENEGRGKRPGVPSSQDGTSPRGQKESKEHQPLPSVWDVLEREVRMWAPDSPRMTSEEHRREVLEVSRLEEDLDERGSARDKLIFSLYESVLAMPTSGSLLDLRNLSLEEFQQFRSRVEPMSEEEIAEKICKQKDENNRKWEDIHKSRGLSLPGMARH
jgi:hypothetical protein